MSRIGLKISFISLSLLSHSTGLKALDTESQDTATANLNLLEQYNQTDEPVDRPVDVTNPIFIFMCVVYILLIISAFISNLIVILVYKLGLSNKTELSSFLVNLAIADFIVAFVCMPFTFAQVLLKKWIFGVFMCPIVLFAQVLTVSVSVYTLVAIGIDR